MSRTIITLTNTPTPYNNEFFACLAKEFDCRVDAYYAHQKTQRRLWGDLQTHTVHAHYIDANPLRLLQLLKHIMFNPPALIITSGIHQPHGLVGAIAGRLRGVGVLLWSEAYQLQAQTPLKTALRKVLRSIQWRLVDGVLPIGAVALESYRQLGLPKTAPTMLLPYCRANIETLALSEAEYRQRPYDLVFVGQLIHRKGWDIALQATHALNQQSRRVRLLILGDGPEREQVAAEIERLGLTTHVQLAGFVQPHELYQQLRQARALLFPSRNDGWGLVVNEALLNGLPVIGGAGAGAVTGLIRDGANGYICEPTVASFAQGIQRFLDSEQLQLAHAALATAQANSCEVYAQRLADFCAQLGFSSLDRTQSSA